MKAGGPGQARLTGSLGMQAVRPPNLEPATGSAFFEAQVTACDGR